MLWKREMTALGISHPWAVAVLALILALPLILHACPETCSCPNPREVLCTFSHLTSVPLGLPKDTQRFNMGYNSILAVGVSDFTGLRRLEMLMLHGNDIQSVSPGAFYNLRSLRILKLSHNKLKTLTHSIFEGLSSLTRLHLDHNAIEFIEPFSFSGLSSLTLLNLEGNRLRDLHPRTFVTLSFLGTFWGSSLHYLYLSDNQMDYLLPGTLQGLNNLESLSLHGNPWACDCNLQWLLQWNNKNRGVIKCKTEEELGRSANCASCSSPQSLNNSQIFKLSSSQFSCDRPTLHSPLKLRESTVWQDTDSDMPYTKDLEPPLGHLTFMLSDSHGNMAYVDCVVKHQTEGTAMSWRNLRFPGQVALNVTLMSLLECEIDRDELQQLWRLVAYYYERPAILQRGLRQENASRATFQYSQAFSEDSPYFTDLKGHLIAEPAWLLQPVVTVQLNRQRTTSKTLVINFSTFISKQISSREEKGSSKHTWAFVQRGASGRIQTVLEGSDVTLECKVSSSGQVSVEWLLPDLSSLTIHHDRIISENKKLMIGKAKPSDSGLYYCVVYTKTDVDVVSFRLIVGDRKLSPEHLNGKEISVNSGGSVTLPCSISSVEPSGISWYLPTDIILQPSSTKGRSSMLSNGSLVIINATHDDDGGYSCLAANLYGADMLSHQIVIRGKKNSAQNDTRESSKQPMRGSESETQKFEDKDEGQGSGYLEMEHLNLVNSPNLQGAHGGSGAPLHRDNNEKKITEGKKKTNKSFKILDISHWTQNQAKGKSKAQSVMPTPQQTTATYTHTTASSTTATIRTSTIPTTTFSLGSDNVVTARKSVKIHNDFESLKIKVQSPMQNINQPPKFPATVVYHGNGESSVFTSSLVSPSSVTDSYMENVFVTPLGEGRDFGEEKILSKSKVTQTPRQRPPFKRRRPFRRGHSSRKPYLHPHDKVKTMQGTISHTVTNKEHKSSASRDSFKSQMLENNKISTERSELLRGSTIIDGTSKQYFLTSGAHLLTVTKTPIQIYTDAYSGVTKHPPSTAIINSVLQTTKIDKKPLNTNNRHLIRFFDKANRKWTWKTADHTNQIHLSRVSRPPVSSSTDSHSLTMEAMPPVFKTVISAQHVTQAPAVPFKSQAHEHLPNKGKEMLTSSSSSNSKNIPQDLETVTSGEYVHQMGEKVMKENTFEKDSLKYVLKSSKSPEVQAGSPGILQWHTQGKVTVPPTASTFSWGHSNQVHVWPSTGSSQQELLSHGGQDARVSDRLKIVVPSTNIPTIIASSESPETKTTTFLTFHSPQSNTSSKTKDHEFFSRLRNRYKQHKLDVYRLFQAGKAVTPNPSMNVFNLRPQQAPTSPQHKSAVTPVSSLSTNQPHSTIQYDGRWHDSHLSPRLTGNGMKPKISPVTTASLSALIETDVSMPCESLGEPRPVMSWTKVSSGTTIDSNTNKGHRFEVLRNGTLVIKNVQLQDRGQYICTAKNTFGSDQTVVTLAVMTQPPKIVPPKSTVMSVYLGHPFNLNCEAEGKPKAEISWILPDGTAASGTHLLNAAPYVLTNGSLRVEAANLSSIGDYKCIASSIAGADTILYHIHVVASAPTIIEEVTEDISLPMGSNAYIYCTSKGEPKPILEWTIPSGVKSKPSQFLGGRIFVFSNGTLFVRNISLTDSGRYKCSATNQAGTAWRVVQLDIRPEHSTPQKPLPKQHVTVIYGSTTFLHCPGFTNLQQGAVWRLPSEVVLDSRNSPDGSITAFPNGTLKIQQITEKDGGSYHCMFLTSSGKDVKLFQVEVLMKPPKIERFTTTYKRVAFGENFLIDCLASGIPAPDVLWSLPDGTVINNSFLYDGRGALPRHFVFGNGTLLLQQISKRDEGDYTCFARNKLGHDVMKVRISLLPDSPRILSKDHVSVRGLLGEPVYIKCQAIGEPTPTITWFSPSNATIPTSSIRYQILGDGTLIIRKVDLTDQGRYACVARSFAGYDVKNIQLEVEGGAPRIHRQGGRTAMKVSAVFHQTLLLDCKAEGLPEPHITWTTSNGIGLPTPYMGGRFQVHRNGSLELRALRKTDEGQYVCLAQNNLGEARLEIELEVKALTEKPSFSTPNTEVVPFKPGSNEVTLGCYAAGKPVPDFVWVLPNSMELVAGATLQRFHHFPGSGVLRILQPENGDMGVYRCLANNLAGQAEKQYVLEPGWKPRIQAKPMAVRISFGQNLNLPCPVDAWPQAAISWTLPNGRVLRRPQVIGRVAYLENGTLELREAATFDRGTYTCKAANAFGSSVMSHTVVVTVYPPRITNAFPSVSVVSRDSAAKLTCRAVGIPTPDISWTLPGSTTLTSSSPITAPSGMHVTVDGSLIIQNPMLMNSGIYKCNARSAVGVDFKATYLQVL